VTEKTPITLTVNGIDIKFNVGIDDYNAYVNEMQPTNKVGPSHNFLVRTADPGSKAELQAALLSPGAALNMAGALVTEYMPEVRVSVKK